MQTKPTECGAHTAAFLIQQGSHRSINRSTHIMVYHNCTMPTWMTRHADAATRLQQDVGQFMAPTSRPVSMTRPTSVTRVPPNTRDCKLGTALTHCMLPSATWTHQHICVNKTLARKTTVMHSAPKPWHQCTAHTATTMTYHSHVRSIPLAPVHLNTLALMIPWTFIH